jgi:hypothetical protein
VRFDYPTLGKERQGWGTRQLVAWIETKSAEQTSHKGRHIGPISRTEPHRIPYFAIWLQPRLRNKTACVDQTSPVSTGIRGSVSKVPCVLDFCKVR